MPTDCIIIFTTSKSHDYFLNLCFPFTIILRTLAIVTSAIYMSQFTHSQLQLCAFANFWHTSTYNSVAAHCFFTNFEKRQLPSIVCLRFTRLFTSHFACCRRFLVQFPDFTSEKTRTISSLQSNKEFVWRKGDTTQHSTRRNKQKEVCV